MLASCVVCVGWLNNSCSSNCLHEFAQSVQTIISISLLMFLLHARTRRKFVYCAIYDMLFIYSVCEGMGEGGECEEDTLIALSVLLNVFFNDAYIHIHDGFENNRTQISIND